MADRTDLVLQYDTLRDRGKTELDAGNLQDALRIFDAAHAVAEGAGDQERIDLAFCNRTAVAMMLVSGFIGTLIGRHLLVKMGERWFRPILNTILLLLALRLAWQATETLLAG